MTRSAAFFAKFIANICCLCYGCLMVNSYLIIFTLYFSLGRLHAGLDVLGRVLGVQILAQLPDHVIRIMLRPLYYIMCGII